MKLDRRGVTFKGGDGWYWPFPRLRFRLRNGYWCEHVRLDPNGHTVVEPGNEWTLSRQVVPAWLLGDSGRVDGWRMIDLGRRQMRRCSECDWAEFR